MALTFGDLVSTGEEVVVLTGNQIFEFEDLIKSVPPQRVNHAQVLAQTKNAGKICGYRTIMGHERAGEPLGYFAGRRWFAEREAQISPPGSWPVDRLASPLQREFRTRIALDAAQYARVCREVGPISSLERAQELFIERLTEAIETYDLGRTQLIDSLRQQLTAALNRMPRPTMIPLELLRSQDSSGMAIWPHAAGDSLEGRAPIFPEGSFYYGDGGIPVPIGPDFVAGPRFDPVPERDEAAQAALDHLESDGA